jgi:hypothetical protein
LNKGGDDNAAAAAAAGGGEANYKLFSELEAIYKPGSGGAQTGSGSGLTGDDNAAILEEPGMAADLPGSAAAPQVNNNTSERKRKRKRKAVAEQVSASASFFERLVQRLMEHQESVHRQFLDAMERRERDRAARDEAWRRQESDEFAREAAARAQDRASAAAREAAIVAYLEKLSGETITLPPPGQQAEAGDEGKMMMVSSSSSSSRWPKHEVEALIRVRTGLESRFQEPGLKGPLWEEVSARMAAAGYPRRGAKRCKEKWENINKYFRKAMESGKRRPSQAKTCPYFDELDRLYSSSRSNPTSSELLDAVVKYPEGAAEDDGHGKEEEDAIGRGKATTDDPEEESHHGEEDDEEANHH